MFKDKDKQKEANRKASRHARIKRKVKTDLTPLAQGMTRDKPKGMTAMPDKYPRVSDAEHQRLIKVGYRQYEYEPLNGDEPVGEAWQGTGVA